MQQRLVIVADWWYTRHGGPRLFNALVLNGFLCAN